jgi:hypothetical protein
MGLEQSFLIPVNRHYSCYSLNKNQEWDCGTLQLSKIPIDRD